MNRDSNDTQRVKLTGEEIAKHVTKAKVSPVTAQCHGKTTN
jgi:hypothetical protein